jgi:hypothetical protein
MGKTYFAVLVHLCHVSSTAEHDKAFYLSISTRRHTVKKQQHGNGSLQTNNNVGGAGAVARDNMDRVIFAACTPLLDYTDVEEAEARTALLGLCILSHQDPVRVSLQLCQKFQTIVTLVKL